VSWLGCRLTGVVPCRNDRQKIIEPVYTDISRGVQGWDQDIGPNLYYCDSEGTRVKGQKFSVGSGSPYAYGVLDEGYKFDMEVEEACELGRRSIYHATFRCVWKYTIFLAFSLLFEFLTNIFLAQMHSDF